MLLGDGLGLPADDGSVVSYVGAVADGRGRRIALSWVLGAAAVELMDGERQQRVMALAVEADMTARRRPAYFGASAAVLLAAAAAAVLVVACGAAAVALFAAAAAEGRWRPQVLGSHCSRASLCVGSGATPVVATAATAAAASTVPPSRQTTQALAQPRPSAQQRSQQPQGDQRLRQSPSELQSVMVRQASAPASPRSKS